MTLNDGPAFRDLMRTVSAGRGKRLSDEELDGVWLLVNDLSLAEFERGLIAAAKATRYFPTPAEIRDYVLKQRDDRAVTPAVMAMLDGDEVGCVVCEDTGWRPTTRDAATVYGPGVVVPAVSLCGCRATNPIWQARRIHARRLGSTGMKLGSRDD